MYLTQALHRAVQQDPRRALTICGERVRSVSESADRVARLAAGLRALGVERGDRVPAEIGFALRDAAPAVLIAAVARPAADRTVTSGHLRDLRRTRSPAAAREPLTAALEGFAQLGAASGLSNKQIGERLFLSSRTVGYHLYQIFPKLGVTSRAALRDALKDLPPAGDVERPPTG